MPRGCDVADGEPVRSELGKQMGDSRREIFGIETPGGEGLRSPAGVGQWLGRPPVFQTEGAEESLLGLGKKSQLFLLQLHRLIHQPVNSQL